MFEIEVSNRQSAYAVDAQDLTNAVDTVLRGEEITSATISIAVVDDAMIRRLNKQYLDHDYATDVLSFLLEEKEDGIEGQIIVSVETADRVAGQYEWHAVDEMRLYAIHAALHLVGYDDRTDLERAKMREKEAHYLQLLGTTAPHDTVRHAAPSADDNARLSR